MRILLLIAAVAFLCGCSTSPHGADSVTLEFRSAQSKPDEALTEMTIQKSGQKVYVEDDVLLSNADLASASVITNGQGSVAIQVEFTELGGKQFAKVTEANINKHIAILVGGNLVSAPRVHEKIMGRKCQIIGSFTPEEAERIAAGIVPR